jgi:hypothetical protein
MLRACRRIGSNSRNRWCTYVRPERLAKLTNAGKRDTGVDHTPRSLRSRAGRAYVLTATTAWQINLCPDAAGVQGSAGQANSGCGLGGNAALHAGFERWLEVHLIRQAASTGQVTGLGIPRAQSEIE